MERRAREHIDSEIDVMTNPDEYQSRGRLRVIARECVGPTVMVKVMPEVAANRPVTGEKTLRKN